MRVWTVLAVCGVAMVACGVVKATDNSLTSEERANGWKLLFDGKSFAGWHAATSMKNWTIEDGSIAAIPGKSDYLITDETFGSFILSVDFREDENTNSGVFLRRPVKPENGLRGIEVQIYKPQPGKPDNHSCGAIYDAVAPTKNCCKGPGVWQNLSIYCRDNVIRVSLNGELITTMNLDEWTVAGKAPNGSPNKFKVPYKNMPRVGYIALQNHSTKVWFKNIKIKRLGQPEAPKQQGGNN